MNITPLTAAIGAEIVGIDLADVSDDQIEELRKAWLDHQVLFFRNQDISVEDHIEFGARWGELEVHPFVADDGGHPELVVIETTPEKRYAATVWHSDVTWRQEPSMGSILRGRIIPHAGGDTVWASATKAYDRLSDAWKERIEGLTAVHDFTKTFRSKDAEADREKYPIAKHPVVRTHPETGARAIYTNRAFTTHIQGVTAEESREVILHLERAVMDPSVQCRFRWEENSFAMWDNRCTQHYATDDFWPGHRRVERVTIVGDRPY